MNVFIVIWIPSDGKVAFETTFRQSLKLLIKQNDTTLWKHTEVAVSPS